jgi:hypothetical protein
LELRHKEDLEERRSEVQPQPQAVCLAASQEVDSAVERQLGHQVLLVVGSQVASELIPHLDSEHLPLLLVPLRQAALEETALMHKDNRQASELLRLLHSVRLLLLLVHQHLQPLAPIQEALGELVQLQGDSGVLARLQEDSVPQPLLGLEEVPHLRDYLVQQLLHLELPPHLHLEGLIPGLDQVLPLHSELVLLTQV